MEIRPELITVDMPVPVIGADSATTVAGVTYRGPSVDVGNPHLVFAVADRSSLAALDLRDRPATTRLAFPDRRQRRVRRAADPVDGADLHVEMRVHERGVGETLSCGSGTCAVAAVVLRDAGLDRGTVAVDVPGGRLFIEIDATACRLTGPAVVVATGEVSDRCA